MVLQEASSDNQAGEIQVSIRAQDIVGVTPQQATAIQERFRNEISLTDDFGPLEFVAGVDVKIGKLRAEGMCGIVVMSYPELEIVETRIHEALVDFPYIPGLLAFREVPIFLETWKFLHARPDIIFFDGHGYAHPRRFGFACHAGLLVDKPSIGCAKSRLVGTYDSPGYEAGSISPLLRAGWRAHRRRRSHQGRGESHFCFARPQGVVRHCIAAGAGMRTRIPDT